jgi:DNA-binding SARP family transcriptional activator
VLRIRLFGRFSVEHEETALDGFHLSNLQRLFSYLLYYRDRPHPREQLADLLWQRSSPLQARKHLRQALWQLQSALDSKAETGDRPILMVEPDWVQVHPQAGLWLDVAEFRRTSDGVRGVQGRDLSETAVERLKIAIELYRGQLLEGCYEEWCLHERRRLQNIHLVMLGKLIDHCEAHQQIEAGMVYGAHILRYDRAHEQTHRRLMRLYYLAGDRTASLRQFEHCASILDEELAVEPTERTKALYEQIKHDQLAPPTPTAATRLGSRPDMKEILNHLERMGKSLNTLQREIGRINHEIAVMRAQLPPE